MLMSLTLELTPELESRLRQQAGRHGVSVREYALSLLQTLAGVFDSPGADRAAVLASAARLYDLRLVSLGTAAELAGVSQSDLIDALGRAGIAVCQYSAEETLAEAAAV
jgi:hypothetical protein